jgi:hypothetical protein
LLVRLAVYLAANKVNTPSDEDLQATLPAHRSTSKYHAKEYEMKTKAERFIDHVQSALIRNRSTVTYSPAVAAVWSLLRELEQASHAAVFIPETLSAEEAAEQFVRFLYEDDAAAPDPDDVPHWLRTYVIAELEMSCAEHQSGLNTEHFKASERISVGGFFAGRTFEDSDEVKNEPSPRRHNLAKMCAIS